MKAGPRKGQTRTSPLLSPRSERRAASATAASPGSTDSTSGASATGSAASPAPRSRSAVAGSTAGLLGSGSTRQEFSQAKTKSRIQLSRLPEKFGGRPVFARSFVLYWRGREGWGSRNRQ